MTTDEKSLAKQFLFLRTDAKTRKMFENFPSSSKTKRPFLKYSKNCSDTTFINSRYQVYHAETLDEVPLPQ